MRFEDIARCSKGPWGQRSPEFVQGHQGSLSVKNLKKLQYMHLKYF